MILKKIYQYFSESFTPVPPIYQRRTFALISLKKHIDVHRDSVAAPAVEGFRAVLRAMADCGHRAFPSLSEDLKKRLAQIETGLSESVSPDRIASAAQEVEAELSAWADQVLAHQSESEREMKEVFAVLTRATESVTARDEKYSNEIKGLTGKLTGIASMNSLVAIRRSIVESAASLKTCVEKMAEESRQSVAQLTAEVNEYRDRLQTSEKLSTTDPLTDLYNRRAFEHQLETFIERGRSFSLIMIDLNGFKAINDAHGHLAGDDLLRQFSLKLAAQFTANDIVARWGGDEFAILITGRLAQIEDRVSRIRRCALGEYWICACQAHRPLRKAIARNRFLRFSPPPSA